MEARIEHHKNYYVVRVGHLKAVVSTHKQAVKTAKKMADDQRSYQYAKEHPEILEV